MFIAIHWTFRDSGSLLSLRSSHLGGDGSLLCTYFTLWWRIGSSLFVSFQVWITSSQSYPSNLEGWTFKNPRIGCVRPSQMTPERSVKLRSLNNSQGWHIKTIFPRWVMFPIPLGIKINKLTNKPRQRKKCHGVQKRPRTFFFTRTVKQTGK